MRIIAGSFKGTSLLLTKNKITRPLRDSVRESIFNILSYSNKINCKFYKMKVLDLYSGTGSFGLECLSRGVSGVSFVESNIHAVDILKKNIDKLKLTNKTNIFFEDTLKILKKNKIVEKFEIVFCDPPFKYKHVNKIIELVYTSNLLTKDGICLLHLNRNTKYELKNYFKLLDERIYGISKILFTKILS